MASVSSLISTGHQIDCSFILEKDLSQLTPVTLPVTMYSQNKTAVSTANQHTIAMLTARARTPIGFIDPNYFPSTLRQHQMLLYEWVDFFLILLSTAFMSPIRHYRHGRLCEAAYRRDVHLLLPYYSLISPSREVSGSKLLPP
jgi:hypothetical protein